VADASIAALVVACREAAALGIMPRQSVNGIDPVTLLMMRRAHMLMFARRCGLGKKCESGGSSCHCHQFHFSILSYSSSFTSSHPPNKTPAVTAGVADDVASS
jgi:hypothetical protein